MSKSSIGLARQAIGRAYNNHKEGIERISCIQQWRVPNSRDDN